MSVLFIYCVGLRAEQGRTLATESLARAVSEPALPRSCLLCTCKKARVKAEFVSVIKASLTLLSVNVFPLLPHISKTCDHDGTQVIRQEPTCVCVT